MYRPSSRRAVVLLLSAMPLAQGTVPTILGTVRTSPQYVTVSTTASHATATPGSTVSLFVDVTPKPGIHVYAPGAKDYRPITLKLAPVPGVAVRTAKFPKSAMLFFEPLNERVPVYQKPFRITDEIVIGRAVNEKTLTLTGTVEYQACDDKTCYPPATVPVSWTLTVQFTLP